MFSPIRDLRAFNLGKSAKTESSPPQIDVAKSIAEKAKTSAAVIWIIIMERARTKKQINKLMTLIALKFGTLFDI